jgi:hypothetical protein
MSTIDETVKCVCGAVEMKATGDMLFSGMCHCKACSRARGMSPVHLVAVGKDGLSVIKGEEFVKIGNGHGSMRHAFCSQCGTGLWQAPENGGFRALFPCTFHIGNPAEPGCILPDKYKPSAHLNYENRLSDWNDDLPKFKTFVQAGVRMTNDGQVIDSLVEATANLSV